MSGPKAVLQWRTREAFSRWVEKVGGEKAAATRLGISRGKVSHLRNGSAALSLTLAGKIEDATGIRCREWLVLRNEVLR